MQCSLGALGARVERVLEGYAILRSNFEGLKRWPLAMGGGRFGIPVRGHKERDAGLHVLRVYYRYHASLCVHYMEWG